MRESRFGIREHRPQPDRPAPILRYESYTLQVERFDQRTQVVDVFIQLQQLLRLVAEAATQMIDGNAPIPVSQPQNEPPPMERPRRVAMHEQQALGVAVAKLTLRPFIHIVHAPVRPLKPMRRERIQSSPICTLSRHAKFR